MSKNRFLSGVSDLFSDFSRGYSANKIYQDLSHLSDSDLKRMGLRREELAYHAYKSAFDA